MKKVTAFIYVLRNSLFNASYYKELLTTNASFTFKYLFVVGLIFSLVNTIAVYFVINKELKPFVMGFEQNIKALYPSDLIISGKNGTWELNQPLPYMIQTPGWLLQAVEADDSATPFPNNLIVFDKNGTIDDLAYMDTLVLINEKNLIMKDKEGFKVQPLENIQDSSLTKADFDKAIDSITPYVLALPMIISVFVFMFMMILVFSQGFFAAILCGVVLLVASKVFNRILNFGGAFKIALHVLPVFFVLELLNNFSGTVLKTNINGWILTFVYIAYAVFMYKTMENDAKA